MLAPNNPSLKSWLDIPANSDFSIQNIPFGIFQTGKHGSRGCTAM
ncbi:MAG: fumarylacetoacetase, partial [Bacteroidota bacterium]